MHFDQDDGSLRLHDGDTTLAEYVFAPADPPIESPRPYALLRSRSGGDVTAYRPDDHVWHKGLSLALPVVGPHNFWGGPTYVHGEGYVQLPNNGAQVHRSFHASATPIADAVAGLARIDETLEWIAASGVAVLAEERTLTARAVDEDTWALTWRSALRNTAGEALAFGSPTSKGRENAGYAGIFWRGPEAFTGGAITGPHGVVGDAARGERGTWLAFSAPDELAGVLVLDASAGDLADPPWFARSEEYAGLNPAPFFFHDTVLAPEASLVLAAAVVIGRSDVASLAATVGANLVAELRSSGPRSESEDPR